MRRIAGTSISERQVAHAGSIRLGSGDRVKVIRGAGERAAYVGQIGEIIMHRGLGKFRVILEGGMVPTFDSADLQKI